MRYEARVTAYDVMHQVQVTLVVYSNEGAEEGHYQPVLSITDTVAGEGQGDPREWARDALLAIMERL